MKIKFFNMIDYVLLLCILVLTTLGIAFIYSSAIDSTGTLRTTEFIKQIIWASAGLVLMILMALYDYRRLYRYAKYFIVGIVVVLIYTRLFGAKVNGARSWIGVGSLGIQPSEVSKVFFIVFFAWFLDYSKNMQERKRFIFSLLLLLIPMGLILLQPDLGTASVFVPIFLFMCFMAGVPVKYLALVLSAGLLTIIITVIPVWQSEILHKTIPFLSVLTSTKLRFLLIAVTLIITIIGAIGNLVFKQKYFYWITYVFGVITFALVASLGAEKVLKPYQIQRLIVFIDPSSDPRGSGWNIIQSEIAIGSGNLSGRGFMKGTQSHYRFLPQQSTDFIFSIYSEETGFLGGVFLFAIFLIIFLRIIYIIRQTTNNFGSYIASGILGMFFFHFMVNVGMVMGVMPITGIPLPFLSYGGSALLTNMLAVGLLMSINARRLDFSAMAM